ncbi:MAG: STAS domain-containing protein [Lachnospiraceae bacterium]|nr:STAS domain-containing protein [Lachnospiraceae bacterium]
MNIIKTANGDQLTIAIEGRLDTTTAPQLESELKASLDGVKSLIIDLGQLDYISSAGLRVLLFAQKTMNKQGSDNPMVVKNSNAAIMEIFEVTGFSDILTIE